MVLLFFGNLYYISPFQQSALGKAFLPWAKYYRVYYNQQLIFWVYVPDILLSAIPKKKKSFLQATSF